MFRGLYCVATFWFVAFPSLAQETVLTVAEPVLDACFFGVAEQPIKFTKPEAKGRYSDCQGLLVARAAELSEEEKFYAHINLAKLAHFSQDYDGISDAITEARKWISTTDLEQEATSRADKVRIFDILLRVIFEEPGLALAEAKKFSDERADMYLAHKLYQNIAFLEEDMEAASEASKRYLRLRPSAREMLGLSMLQANSGNLQEASDTAVAALEIADNQNMRGEVFLEYLRLQSRLGNYDQALRVLDMLDKDKTPDQRQLLLEQSFGSNDLILNRRVFALRNFEHIKEAKIERAIIALEQGDRKAAVALTEGLYLRCRNVRCLQLELAIAEEKERAQEADRVRQRIDRTVFSLTRRFGSWEKNLLAQLGTPPRERYTSAGEAKPDFDVTEKTAGVYRVEFSTEAPQSRDKLERRSVAYARRIMREKGYEAFKILTVFEGYRTRNKRGETSFAGHIWRLEMLPVKQIASVPQDQVWRYIRVQD